MSQEIPHTVIIMPGKASQIQSWTQPKKTQFPIGGIKQDYEGGLKTQIAWK